MAAKRFGIVAALPRELALLVGKLKPDAVSLEQGIARYELPNAVVVAAGMGAGRAMLAVEACGDVETLISVGLAGACSPRLMPGSVAEARVVLDTQTGERYGAASTTDIVLATTPVIASVAEKARLALAYDAAMVDMEAAAVARLARTRDLPFRAIKAISDAHDFELEGLSKFAGPRGEFRTGAFALYTALRPAMWPKAIKLGGDSSRALKALTAKLQQVIAEP
ncbi:phosphorylase [Granulicella cerasi]|uniref:Phosphorylase n=1 Tax=Granulicella cerasi TaxID=741063 RepID=A0ABW1Z500_9BACT|nr:phosphorylase [Granulicella cerasi]